MTNFIKANNVSLGYEGKCFVENINFTIEEGDYVCIVGENGSGKSSLIKTLVGLNRCMKGNIEFSDAIQKREIGYMPQRSEYNKDFPALVKEIVLSGCLSQGKFCPFYTKEQKNLALKNMEKLGIIDIAKKSFRELSGGQQQRVLLARALCATKNLIILDEPVTGLDPTATAEFYKFLKEINDEGITIIMVSHDVDVALQYANKVLHVSHNTTFFGNVEAYLEQGGSVC